MKKILFVLLALSLIISGCTDSDDYEDNSFIMLNLGDGITAGVQSGALNEFTQKNSYPQLIADQLKETIELVNWSNPLLYTNTTVTYANGTKGRIRPVTLPYNLAAPGTNIDYLIGEKTVYYDYIATGLIPDVNDRNPDISRQLAQSLITLPIPTFSGRDVSQLEAAEYLAQQYPAKKKIFTLWIGYDQVIQTVAYEKGVFLNESNINYFLPNGFDLYFADKLKEIINRLLSLPNSHVFIGNLPDVNNVAAILNKNDLERMAQFDNPSIVTLSNNESVGFGPFLNPDMKDFSIARALCLDNASLNISIGIIKQQYPDYILDESESNTISTRISSINSKIKEIADTYFNVTLVDIDSIFNSVGTAGYAVDITTTITKGYGGGLFSLDGQYLSNTGYALVANAFIKKINEVYDIKTPELDIASISLNDPYVDKDGDGIVQGPTDFQLASTDVKTWDQLVSTTPKTLEEAQQIAKDNNVSFEFYLAAQSAGKSITDYQSAVLLQTLADPLDVSGSEESKLVSSPYISGNFYEATNSDPYIMINLGDGLTCGVQSGTVNEFTQRNGYPELLAGQLMKTIDLINWHNPLLYTNTTVLYKDGSKARKDKLIPYNLGVAGSSILGLNSEKSVFYSILYPNLIPDLNKRPPDIQRQLLLSLVTLPIQMFSQTEVSAIDAAHFLAERLNDKKKIITLWIGYDQVLQTIANNGGTTLTSENIDNFLPSGFEVIFAQLLSQIVDRLLEFPDTHLFIGNIPDVNNVAYILNKEDLEHLSHGNIQLDNLLQDNEAIGFGPFLNPDSSQTGLANGIVGGNITLVTNNIMGMKIYMKDYFLDETESYTITTRINKINEKINEICNDNNNVTLVNLYQLFEDVRDGNIVVNDKTLRKGYGRGFFSLDGQYLSNTGYALVANEFIDQINNIYGINVPKVDIELISSTDPYNDKDGDGFVPGPTSFDLAPTIIKEKEELYKTTIEDPSFVDYMIDNFPDYLMAQSAGKSLTDYGNAKLLKFLEDPNDDPESGMASECIAPYFDPTLSGCQ